MIFLRFIPLFLCLIIITLSQQAGLQRGNRDETLSYETPCPDCESIVSYQLSTTASRSYHAYVKSAYKYFWSHDLLNSYACACKALEENSRLKLQQDLSILHGIMFALSHARHPDLEIHLANKKIELPVTEPRTIDFWEVLGPFPVSKLEIDGDPAFLKWDGKSDPIGEFLMSSSSSELFFSELASHGIVSWATLTTDSNGQAIVQFQNINWNGLGNGLGTSSVFEFQGWLRTDTFVKSNGNYAIECQGAHTVYVRNDNRTRVVTGDIYKFGQSLGVIDLKLGPVGILVPIRGVIQTSVKCTLQPLVPNVYAYPAMHLPTILEIPTLLGGKQKHGALISDCFSVPVVSSLSHTVTVEISLEASKPLNGVIDVVIAQVIDMNSTLYDGKTAILKSRIFSIVPGQLLSLPLQIVRLNQNNNGIDRDKYVFIPCKKKGLINIVFRPSRGDTLKIPIDLTCRSMEESSLFSYIDRDGSISQTGLLFPLHYTRQLDSASHKTSHEFPYILSLHGTGVTPLNQADAYKYKPKEKNSNDPYEFGVEGFFVICPGRHGAHNWEAIGDQSSFAAVRAVHDLLSLYNLPQVDIEHSVVAGHSMGGHGAWLYASNHPDSTVCLSSSSSWIRKEEYSTANAFFQLDIQNTFTDIGLKSILEQSLSEFHVDRLVSNLQFTDINIRVGSEDKTTHPWFSRRMYRLLKGNLGFNVTLEEVPGKDHWWWDTLVSNDGGTLNDKNMRNFYARCKEKIDRLKNDSARKCKSKFEINSYNPSSQDGLCGIRVIQQLLSLKVSTVRVSYKFESALYALNLDGNSETMVGKEGSSAIIVTRNVQRLLIQCHFLKSVSSLVINEYIIEIPVNCISSIVVCIDRFNQAWKCRDSVSLEKLLVNSGPIRHIYTRPVCIVYGTPSSSSLRNIIKDYAVYLANSIYAAHHTSVRIMSDMDFKSTKWRNDAEVFRNIIMIGGPTLNKAMNQCINSVVKDGVIVTCNSPVRFPSDERLQGTRTNDKLKAADNENVDVVMGLCIHAVSEIGWLHATRASWPVVPPMVRAPFANYFPDYIVFSNRIWSEGFGGVLAAGYWDGNWKFDDKQAYIK